MLSVIYKSLWMAKHWI